MQFDPRTGIQFICVEGAPRLHSLLRDLDSGRADEWLYTGSVYVDGLRARRDQVLRAGQILRLHTRRKRYPVPRPLRARVVAETADLLVLDKPAGLPTHATLDNFVENARFVLEQEIGRPLYTTHRLDVPTEGLLIVAKTPPAQARINQLFARGEVEKIYYAWSEHAVPPGPYRHFIAPTQMVPRPIAPAADHDSPPPAGFWDCRLIVEDSTKQNDFTQRHRVRLLTGKTHQIRAQFAALGAPLLGDVTYGAKASGLFGLVCAELSFPWNSERLRFTRS